MENAGSGLVEITREFLMAFRRTREIGALYRSGELTFEDVRGWVGDDESSALFRLKEQCHGLFRESDPPAGTAGPAGPETREALFDLTVGALFHEAMRFRENLYQREVYGSRVRRLAGRSEEEADLIREFDKIVAGASMRLDEALQETEVLLDQTRRQFRGLLAARPAEGLVARFLVENAGYVVLVFDSGVDGLFGEIHGDPAEGYALAARSYLASGRFQEGAQLLAEARRRGGEREAWLRLADYAAGMEAYLDGEYDASMKSLGSWLDREPPADEAAFATLALDAVSHLGRLTMGDEGRRIAAEAERLGERLQALSGEAKPVPPSA